MNKLDETYQRLIDEESALQRRLEVISFQLQALRDAGATSNGITPPAPVKTTGKLVSHASGKRAKSGELWGAIERALSRGGLTNGALRDSVRESGYAFSLERLHFSKTLQRYVGLGKLRVSGPKNNRVYDLKNSEGGARKTA